jgi:serine/threonine protein kinase
MGDGTVKVGDFGLSRSAADLALNRGISAPAVLSGHLGGVVGSDGLLCNDEGVSPPDTPLLRAVSIDSPRETLSKQGKGRWGDDNDITSGIGTLLYASPEQTAGGDYGPKTDVYSLGIMLFEMCHPVFETAMERVVVLRNLQKQQLSTKWAVQESHPSVANLLLSMLAPEPQNRPSAGQVAMVVKKLLNGGSPSNSICNGSSGGSDNGNGVLSLLHGAHLLKLHVEVDLSGALHTSSESSPRSARPPPGSAAAVDAVNAELPAENDAKSTVAAAADALALVAASAAPEEGRRPSSNNAAAGADHRHREPSAEAKHQIRAAIVGAAPRVRIEQYLLRESGSAALMEFALADLDASACTKVTGAVAALLFVRKVCFV